MVSEEIKRDELYKTFIAVLQVMICKGEGASNKIRELLDPDFSGFGTGKEESIKNLNHYFNFFNREIEQFISLNYQLHWSRIKISGTTGVVECELDLIVQISEDVLKIFTRITFVFENRLEKWICLSAHYSFPSYEQAEGDALPVDAWKAKNQELEEMVAKRTALLQKKTEELEEALDSLRKAQAQLIQQEKLASLGELTAGIAHEIQNPLNFVNNFSEVNTELIAEMEQEIAAGNMTEVKSIVNDIQENEQKIRYHGQRANSIVKGMLQHSRASTGQKEPTDLNTLAEEYLRLAYQGLRAKDKNFNAKLVTAFDSQLNKVNVGPQEIGRVLLNLYNNAFYALQQKQNRLNGQYQPEVKVSTAQHDGQVKISVRDNGGGIPENVKSKIFQPFFTTKPSGQGTGLGLSLSYDIITKGHGGELRVETQEGEYSEFIIQLSTLR